MSSIHLLNTLAVPLRSFSPPSLFPQCHSPLRSSSAVPKRRRFSNSSGFRLASSQTVNSVPRANGTYTVSDFMTKKQDLHVVKTTTTVDEGTSMFYSILLCDLLYSFIYLSLIIFFWILALEALVNNRISGLPVIDEDWNLVGVVSDYDLLAIDSISGGPQSDANLFPDVDSTWKTFNELQKLLSKTNGQVVGDLMTPTPLVVHESTSLEEAARLLLETKYRRLPVVDDDGKLVGLITRGNIVKAALLSKRAGEW
ncbi:CBS domain-containing protein CBSX1, chloroplastic isoform X1 [Glycine max]|uniref:CBS domain-containing protein CBSX1, chloroplastic isoform X1 n=1 Tax=Glycine max TaxID=3847 RepID=UPI001B357413|nr:CBS domain-containing protein CBSX1, chloroplastic isoform X1 [Glycine max]